MAKKSNKTTTKAKTKLHTKKATTASHGIRPSVGIIFTLFVALIIAITFAMVSFNQLKSSDTALARAKLAVFDDLAREYIRENDVTPDNGVSEFYQMTGYGISDEDDTFYITFDFADPANMTTSYDEAGNLIVDNAKHGIMYFWEDKDHGTYSHAYSYHDDDYHPAGTYVKVAR